MLNQPSFKGFGRFILPVGTNRFYEGMRLKNLQVFSFSGETPVPHLLLYARGGGFAYVGSIHEGFPYAVELSSKGYNAVVLNYRVGSGLAASRDLAWVSEQMPRGG